ncbi:polysaccharide biosynthesis/export family protein [Ancylobacter terrae]|uniref:polysaccharide biosynthesis/export family protein n=1 Tax=Ancylobacter sp. sgz301288 TaxID=3342077 RepID=UPI0038587150
MGVTSGGHRAGILDGLLMRGMGRSYALLLMVMAVALGACAAPPGNLTAGKPTDNRASSYASDATGNAAGRVNQAIPASVVAEVVPNLGATSVQSGADYLIGPYDVLKIVVFNVPELTGDFQVSPSGQVSLPLVGDVAASNKTTAQLQSDLAANLGRTYLQSPQVSVSVKEYKSQRVTVEGAVVKPGVYNMNGTMTLLQAIAMAEGAKNVAEQENVLVFRQMGAQRAVARFDIKKIRAGKAEDPGLRGGDTVVVAESGAKASIYELLRFVPVASVFAMIL